MKKSLLILALCTTLCGVACAADQQLLSERHIAKGVSCSACHVENPPAKAVATEKCQSCHGGFAQMKAKTAKLKPNPHYTHMGDQPCEECHRAHSQSVNMCDKCHQIKLNVK